MPASWRIADGLILLESDGAGSFEEWKEALRLALTDPASRGIAAVVHDARDVTRIPSLEEAKERVLFLQRQSTASGIRRWAVVVSGIVQLGMARWGEAFHGPSVGRFRAFVDPEEARAWALGSDET